MTIVEHFYEQHSWHHSQISHLQTSEFLVVSSESGTEERYSNYLFLFPALSFIHLTVNLFFYQILACWLFPDVHFSPLKAARTPWFYFFQKCSKNRSIALLGDISNYCMHVFYLKILVTIVYNVNLQAKFYCSFLPM